MTQFSSKRLVSIPFYSDDTVLWNLRDLLYLHLASEENWEPADSEICNIGSRNVGALWLQRVCLSTIQYIHSYPLYINANAFKSFSSVPICIHIY
jgi:hypothetical protein